MMRNKDEYTACGMWRKKLGFRNICEIYFCTGCKKEKNVMKDT